MKKVPRTRCVRHAERKQIRDLPNIHEHVMPIMNAQKFRKYEAARIKYEPSHHVDVMRPLMMKKKK